MSRTSRDSAGAQPLVVLVFGAADGALRFHNPSGDTPASQADSRLPVADFSRFFAGRGIALPGGDAR